MEGGPKEKANFRRSKARSGSSRLVRLHRFQLLDGAASFLGPTKFGSEAAFNADETACWQLRLTSLNRLNQSTGSGQKTGSLFANFDYSGQQSQKYPQKIQTIARIDSRNKPSTSFFEIILVVLRDRYVPPEDSKSAPTKLTSGSARVIISLIFNPQKNALWREEKEVTAMQTTLTAEGTATRGLVKCFCARRNPSAELWKKPRSKSWIFRLNINKIDRTPNISRSSPTANGARNGFVDHETIQQSIQRLLKHPLNYSNSLFLTHSHSV